MRCAATDGAIGSEPSSPFAMMSALSAPSKLPAFMKKPHATYVRRSAGWHRVIGATSQDESVRVTFNAAPGPLCPGFDRVARPSGSTERHLTGTTRLRALKTGTLLLRFVTASRGRQGTADGAGRDVVFLKADLTTPVLQYNMRYSG